MERTLERVREYFSANGGYYLIEQENMTVHKIAHAIWQEGECYVPIVDCVRIVLDELEGKTND